MQAVQVHTTPESREKWANTEETLGDKNLKGAQIDAYIDMGTDNDFRTKVREGMQAKGASEYTIEKGSREMEEYLDILMKMKFKIISRGLQGIVVYRNSREHSTVLLAQSDNGYCEMFRMSTYHYRERGNSIERPEWVSPKSQLAKEINSYRKGRRFWLAFYGKADTGETVAILGKQHFHLNRTLLPYHFNGVILIAKNDGGEMTYSRELIRFLPVHDAFNE